MKVDTRLGRVEVTPINAASLTVTGELIVFSAKYAVKLDLFRQDMYGWRRRSFDDLTLTSAKGEPASFNDREEVLSAVIEKVNEWSDTPAGRAAIEKAQSEHVPPAGDLRKVDL